MGNATIHSTLNQTKVWEVPSAAPLCVCLVDGVGRERDVSFVTRRDGEASLLQPPPLPAVTFTVGPHIRLASCK
ncbi:hypothetical protein J6590_021241 [Homalodisca vitripennis]|nr:hypothetical protein J6590_021241 [Homalodisca vitripennis]